ncbi:hypothetical protein E4U43_004430 [Claviceps pusilla]|uniref:Uncharacterized protein n=1 Tax=Claviceps pusilla TaxID=123648 RepID=A0A9P7STZ7_9HYPO|nr:hypothetical protein E4U43_004430 [Claviceps pusilla]
MPTEIHHVIISQLSSYEFPVGSRAGLGDFINGILQPYGTIDQLAADPRLRLVRFVISSSEEDIYGPRVSKQRLLEWINRNCGLNDGINITELSASNWSLRQGILKGEKFLTDVKKVHDEDVAAAANSLCELPACPRNFCYVEEDLEQIVRREHGSQWRFGSDDDNTIRYWQVYDLKSSGYPTEKWRFEHRNGEVGFGEDPLEIWEDWEGYQSGDKAMASPTPFGDALFGFFWELREGRQKIARGDTATGWGLPCDQTIGRWFSKPVEYKIEDDPVVQICYNDLHDCS